MVQRKKVTDLKGKKFSRLTVIEYIGLGKFNKHYWKCLCDCGKETILNTSSLTSKTTVKSCGCLRAEKLSKNRANPTKHGHLKNNSKLYHVFVSMKQRCYNPNSDRWYCYGAKNIRVCEEWVGDVSRFIEWALENGYKEGLSIDRIDPKKDYSPDNCRWLTRADNTRHRYGLYVEP